MRPDRPDVTPDRPNVPPGKQTLPAGLWVIGIAILGIGLLFVALRDSGDTGGQVVAASPSPPVGGTLPTPPVGSAIGDEDVNLGGNGNSGGGGGGNGEPNNNGGGGSGGEGQGGNQGGNGGQFGGGRDPAVVEACADLDTLYQGAGQLSTTEARRIVRPWKHLTFRRNANLSGDVHLIWTDVFATSPPDPALLLKDLRRMKRDCAKAGA